MCPTCGASMALGTMPRNGSRVSSTSYRSCSVHEGVARMRRVTSFILPQAQRAPVLAAIMAFVLGLSASRCVWADRSEVDLSGPGWRLLRDADAAWESDELFLPPVKLSQLPTNPP